MCLHLSVSLSYYKYLVIWENKQITRFFKYKDFIYKVAFFKNKYVIWLSVQFSGRRLSMQPVPSPEKNILTNLEIDQVFLQSDNLCCITEVFQ